ncbi:MAG: hypothetical protein ACRDBG_26355 [Waterburya sp.]
MPFLNKAIALLGINRIYTNQNMSLFIGYAIACMARHYSFVNTIGKY